MMLDRAGTPDSEVFCGADDVDPVVQCAVIGVTVAPQWTAALAVLLVGGGGSWDRAEG
jgi:hypothetical protein